MLYYKLQNKNKNVTHLKFSKNDKNLPEICQVKVKTVFICIELIKMKGTGKEILQKVFSNPFIMLIPTLQISYYLLASSTYHTLEDKPWYTKLIDAKNVDDY